MPVPQGRQNLQLRPPHSSNGPPTFFIGTRNRLWREKRVWASRATPAPRSEGRLSRVNPPRSHLSRGKAGRCWGGAPRGPPAGPARPPRPRPRPGGPALLRAGSKTRSPAGLGSALAPAPGREAQRHDEFLPGGGCRAEEAGLSVSPQAILSCSPEGTFLGTEGHSAPSAPRCLCPLPLPAPCFFLVPALGHPDSEGRCSSSLARSIPPSPAPLFLLVTVPLPL